MVIWKWIRLRFGQGDSSRWIRVKEEVADEEPEE
jgi:hypothetical protein